MYFLKYIFPEGRPRRVVRRLCFEVLAAALLASLPATLKAQSSIEVKTIGGGPLSLTGPAYGFVDGKSIEQAQFHTPMACAADSLGYLYIADRDNGRIRRMDLARDLTKTYIGGLAQPVDVAVDATNNLYVLSQGSGLLAIYDSYGYLLSTQALFLQPTALALDGKGNIYVAEKSGAVKKTSYYGGPATVVLSGLNQPQGLAFLPNGTLAVSEAGISAVSIWNLQLGTLTQQIGGGAGFQDGPTAVAKFNQPQRLVSAPDGSLLIADQGNHRVRTISTSSRVGTLYGLDPQDWGYDHVDYLGWWDGDFEVAEARDPVGVTIDSKGTVYTTEIYYHIVRSVTGAGIGGGSSNGGGGTTNLSVKVPSISPASGYLPMGQQILVTDENDNLFYERVVYYTTDGTDPTTNSARLYLTNNTGFIPWRETDRDLTSLRVRTFLGTASSTVVSGTIPVNNQIGVHRNVLAGSGATVAIPITLTLNGIDPLRSLQFRVEISPESPTTPAFGTNFVPMEDLTNAGYFNLAEPSTASHPASYLWSGYDSGATHGVAMAYISTNSQFFVDKFAVVALMRATVPASAVEGDRYQIKVFQVSGTSDGGEREVSITPLPPVDLIVTNLAYRVGDTAPGGWYNAGDFGDETVAGTLSNSDVNNAYNAAFGNRVPYMFTDLFDALDAYPLDSDVAAGGDGQIRFLDWQIILRRSLGLDVSDWNAPWRRWSSTGRRIALSHSSASVPAQRNSLAAETSTWTRQVAVGAVPVSGAVRGKVVDVPFYVNVRPNYKVGGMQFRVSVIPEAGALALAQSPEFLAEAGFPSPSQSGAAGKDLLCAWSLTPSPVLPPLQGSNLLGHIRFTIPASSVPGSFYSVHFTYVDASPDFYTQYDCESYPATVGVEVAARPAETVSDEWKTFFFGSYSDPLAASTADPDGDGFTNQEEYLGGLNPTNFDWRYQWQADGIQIRWFGEAGCNYQIESSLDLKQWTAVGETRKGLGTLLEFTDRSGADRIRFYRVRIAP